MILTQDNIELIKSKIKPIIGQKAWNVFLKNDFIVFNFGKPLISRSKKRKKTFGEWCLWVYSCLWRLETSQEVLTYFEEPQDKRKIAVKHLEGLTLRSVELFPPVGDTIFTFEQDVVLRLFSICSEEYPEDEYCHWSIYMPDDNMLQIGPGAKWHCIDSDGKNYDI